MEYSIYDIALIPLVVAIVGLFTKAGVPSKYLPFIAVVLGLLLGLFYVNPEDPKEAILSGIVIGLSAIGGYSGVKNTIQGVKEDDK